MKPSSFFPATVLPSYQEVGKHLDTDGAFTQKADVVLTAGYAASGAVTLTAAAASFSTWPDYGYVENQTTGEIMLFFSNDGTNLSVGATGRGLDGTTATAGLVGHNVRLIEARVLGLIINQLLAEITNIEAAFSSNVDLTATVSLSTSNSHKTHTNVGATGVASGRIATLPTVSTRLRYPFLIENANGLRVKASGTNLIRVEGSLSIAGGYIESVDPGASIVLIGVSSSLWIAAFRSGEWLVETS